MRGGGQISEPEDQTFARATGRRGANMPVALAFALGSFVFIAVLSVVAIGVWSGYRNTVDLLRQKADMVVDAASAQLRLHLSAAEAQAGYIGRAIAEGEIDPGEHEKFLALIHGALASTPQISGLYFIDTSYYLSGADRDRDDVIPVYAGLALDPDIRSLIAEAQTHKKAYWAELLWRDEWRSLQVNMRYPVWRDGKLVGLMLALVSVPSLSEFFADMEQEFGYNAFILVDGDRVLAHPMMQFGLPGLDRWHPLPTITELGDPVLMTMWDKSARDEGTSELLAGHSGHAATLAGDSYVFIYDTIDSYSTRPWMIGTYVRASDLSTELVRLKWAIVACLALLVLVLVTASLLGRRIAAPARAVADRLQKLSLGRSLGSVPPVRSSFFRELNDAVGAVNTFAAVQDRLGREIPQSLLRRVIGQKCMPVGPLREPVTVMVADAIGLGGRTDGLAPDAVERVLARFHGTVAGAVEEAGGTVWHNGAGRITAFWTEDEADSAVRAVAAGRAILDQLCADAGSSGLCARLVLHSGPAVVGPFDYGDGRLWVASGPTVRMAGRIERYARSLAADEPLHSASNGGALLATAETVRAAGTNAVSMGYHTVPGAETPIELFRLV